MAAEASRVAPRRQKIYGFAEGWEIVQNATQKLETALDTFARELLSGSSPSASLRQFLPTAESASVCAMVYNMAIQNNEHNHSATLYEAHLARQRTYLSSVCAALRSDAENGEGSRLLKALNVRWGNFLLAKRVFSQFFAKLYPPAGRPSIDVRTVCAAGGRVVRGLLLGRCIFSLGGGLQSSPTCRCTFRPHPRKR